MLLVLTLAVASVATSPSVGEGLAPSVGEGLAPSVGEGLAPSVGEGLALQWSAPPGCPVEADVRTAVDLNLAREQFGEELDLVKVHGSIVGQAGAWVLHVQTELPSGPVTRELGSDACFELAEAAGLIIAVALDPLRVVETVRRGAAAQRELISAAALAPTKAPPAGEPEKAPKLAARPLRGEDPDGVRQPDPRRLSVDIRVGALGEFGGLTVLRYGVWAGVGIVARRFRLDLAGQYWGPRDVRPFAQTPDAGIKVQLGGVAGRGCFIPTDGAFEVATCLGVEAGVARGRGFGLGRENVGTPPWVAAVIGPEFTWISRRSLGVWVAADAMVHVVRPRWEIEGLGFVAGTRPVGFRLVLGPTLRI